MKKTWVSVKRGLVRDNKHRVAMGESVWLFMYMLDIADWDTGIINDWKDEAAAEDMQMPIRTLREQRRKLAELDYVACNQKQYSQSIEIKNWTNPREYSGETYNKKQGGSKASPQENEQGYTQGYTQGSTQDVTPTYDSKNQIPSSEKKTDETKGRYTTKLPPGSDLGFMLAAGMSSADIADANAQDAAELETLTYYESKMGYGSTLDWWGKNADLVALRKFLVTQTRDDIETFAKWCKRQYSKFRPEDAARFPRNVIVFWPLAFEEKVEMNPNTKIHDPQFRPMPTFVDGVAVWETTK